LKIISLTKLRHDSKRYETRASLLLERPTVAAGPDRPASGNLDVGPRRQCVARAGASAGRPAPRFGDPLPETLEGHAGSVIFGGPMSANDPDDFVRREIDWITVPLREQRPFLGICLGAQMLAMQLGARVAPHPDGRAQIGYYPIRPTAAGRALCPDWPDQVYHWHREGFDLPSGSELLAEGGDFPIEAFRFDDSFGFQFHPDVTYAMMHRWTTRGHARFDLPGARERHHHFADRAVHDVIERAWLKNFLDRWLARIPERAGSELIMAQAAE
jgi:GMP synthase (glutamine-hydrolysing)